VTARSILNGAPIVWDEQQGVWRYEADGAVVAGDGEGFPTERCRLCGDCPVPVPVVVPAEQSCTGETRVAIKPIDACLADVVRRLNAGATEPVTTGCCCGHGEGRGSILLADGRELRVEYPKP